MSQHGMPLVVSLVKARVNGFVQDVRIVESNMHPLGDSLVKVQLLESPALPVPEVWINVRDITDPVWTDVTTMGDSQRRLRNLWTGEERTEPLEDLSK